MLRKILGGIKSQNKEVSLSQVGILKKNTFPEKIQTKSGLQTQRTAVAFAPTPPSLSSNRASEKVGYAYREAHGGRLQSLRALPREMRREYASSMLTGAISGNAISRTTATVKATHRIPRAQLFDVVTKLAETQLKRLPQTSRLK